VAAHTPGLALSAYLERADQLHLGKAHDRSSRELAPGTAMRCGVDDHRPARLVEQGRHVDERAIDEVALDVAVGWRRRQNLADLVELEHDRSLEVGIELGRDGAGQH
jgi:hypothetical protein